MRARPQQVALRLLAELGVIVLGVLIALSADSWVNSRTDRRVEAARVRGLRENVEETIARLAAARAAAEDARQALLSLASPSPAGLTNLDRALSTGLLYGPDFAPELNVYDDLKNSGELGLLSSAPLRQALAKMDAALEGARFSQADLMMVQQLNYDPFVLEELDLVGIWGNRLGVDAAGAPARRTPIDNRLRNLATFKLDLVTQLIEDYEEAQATLQTVRDLIDDPRSQ